MKKVFSNIIGALFVGLAFTACSPEKFDGANISQIPVAADYADCISYSVDQATNTATFNFKESQGVTPVWVVDGSEYSVATTFSKYWRKKGSYTIKCFVKNRNGISDGSVDFTVDIEKTKMNGFEGFDIDSEWNLFKTAPINDISFWFADASWSQIADPTLSQGNGETKIVWATVGPDRWQGQMAINNTGIKIEAGKSYDFSAIVTASNPHPGFKIKLCQQDDDNNILLDKDFKISDAGEPKCFYATEQVAGADISNLKIVFDFGGGADNTEVIIENLVLIETDKNEIEAPVELAEEFNYDDPNNLWKVVDQEQAFTEGAWFGDAGWGDMGVTPESLKPVHDGAKHTITIPATTVNEQWHAQYNFNSIDMPFTGSETIDFSCHVTTSAYLPGMTFKLTQNDNDDNYFFADREEIKKGEYVFRRENVPLSAGSGFDQIKFVFDFAGAEEGTEITISNITIIKK